MPAVATRWRVARHDEEDRRGKPCLATIPGVSCGVKYVFLHIPKNALHSALEEAKRVLQSDGIFYLGVYGGRDFEGYLKCTDYNNDDRFFAFYEFNAYQGILEKFYTVLDTRQVQLSEELVLHAFLLKNQ